MIRQFSGTRAIDYDYLTGHGDPASAIPAFMSLLVGAALLGLSVLVTSWIWAARPDLHPDGHEAPPDRDLRIALALAGFIMTSATVVSLTHPLLPAAVVGLAVLTLIASEIVLIAFMLVVTRRTWRPAPSGPDTPSDDR